VLHLFEKRPSLFRLRTHPPAPVGALHPPREGFGLSELAMRDGDKAPVSASEIPYSQPQRYLATIPIPVQLD
jgi:hypothetical protein